MLSSPARRRPSRHPVLSPALLDVELARVQASLALAADLAAAAPRTVLAWAERHRRLNGQPFSLERFAPLRQLYEDDHPHIVIIKAAQRGVSEYAINLAMFALDVGAQIWGTAGEDGLNVGYLFPTRGAVSDFSKERVAGLKRESETLRQMFNDYDDVTFKQVRGSYLYMRGTQSEDDLHGFRADILIRDEYDRQDPRARTLAEKRLEASTVRRIVDLSTPVLPGQGIDAAYAGSDQHVWEVRCDQCAAWSELDFLGCVRLDGVGHAGGWERWDVERVERSAASVHCPRCHAAIDHCGPGRWRALRPDRTARRGYRVPWYGFPSVRPVAIAADLVSPIPTTVTEAYRSNLGIAYVPKGARVDLAMLERAGVPLPGGPGHVWRDATMGVDVGGVLHYRISAVSSADGLAYVIEAGRVVTWAELSDLLRRHDVQRAVIDAHPELTKAREWQAEHPNVVMRALYPSERALEGRLSREPDEEEGLIYINRTMALDELFAALSRPPTHPQGERWAAPLVHDAEVRAHLTAPVRVLVEDDKGQSRQAWTHTAPDHLAHASVYDRVARAHLPGLGVYF